VLVGAVVIRAPGNTHLKSIGDIVRVDEKICSSLARSGGSRDSADLFP
jgi:hypothetical protein